ncbi:MAG: RluA family pseudouridine synthase [Myxococcales bacterium]|nr:RluA family pseudouridine synthase [Myxococcales bacterium]
MSEKQWEIQPEDEGQRLDKLVARKSGLSRAEVRRLFEEKRVKIGRRPVSKGDVARAGSLLVVSLVEGPPGAIPEENPLIPLRILMERDDIVVVDKPAGQPTAPLRIGETGTLANALAGRYPEMRSLGPNPREPGLIHRLDNDTSGVLVAARIQRAYDALVEALREGKLQKLYLAICHDLDGALPDQGSLEIPLAPHPKDRRRVLACLHPRDVERLAPRPAITYYAVKRRHGDLALLELKAPRALRHQLRAHLAAIRCPLVGDVLYGAPPREDLRRHALHASSVIWGGSAAVPAFTVHSPLPVELERLLDG